MRSDSVFDYTRCVRPDGTAYGTSGTCRKGVESALEKTIKELKKIDPDQLKALWVKETNFEVVPKKFPSRIQMARDIASERVKESADNFKVNKDIDPYLNQLSELHSKIRKIRSLGLPSSEEEWRIYDVEKEIFDVRRKALEATTGKDKARRLFDLEDWKLSATSMSPNQIAQKISSLKYELALSKGDKEQGSLLKTKLKALVEALPTDLERARAARELGVLTGEIKLPKPGTLNGTVKAGKDFLRQYQEGLRSRVSIIKRSEKLEGILRKELSEGPDTIKRRMRLRKAIFNLEHRRSKAETQLVAKMEVIRGKLLSSKLSNKEVEDLVNKVSFVAKKKSPEMIEETKQHLREFVRMFNGKGVEDVDTGEVKRRGLHEITLDPTKRAFAFPDSGTLTTNGPKGTLFHEIGHIVEGQRSWLKDFSGRWRDVRAFSEGELTQKQSAKDLVEGVPYATRSLSGDRQLPVFRLSEMIPLKGRGYLPNEIAVVDTFLSPYLGKVYEDKYTEIASSTFEHFSNSSAMSNLYKKHPDLFTLGVGLAVS
jgi:hypothetical protein